MSEREGRPEGGRGEGRPGGREGGRPGGREGGRGPGGRGPRRPPQRVAVTGVTSIGDRLVSVRVAGGDLSRFAEAPPTSHIKVFLPAPGQDEPVLPEFTENGRVWPEDGDRPTVRTYTPYAYDAATDSLEILFVLHGEGPASSWAEAAEVGTKVAIGGPGGRFELGEGWDEWWIAGDESALPALAQLLGTIPAEASVQAHLEVETPADSIDFPVHPRSTLTRHERAGAEPSTPLLAALAERLTRPVTPTTRFWIACEATAVRDARRLLLDAGVDRDAIITRGYWRRGVSDHPDHDYGED